MMNINNKLSVLLNRLSTTLRESKITAFFPAVAGVTLVLLLAFLFLPTVPAYFGGYQDELGVASEAEQVEIEEALPSNTLAEKAVRKGQSLYTILIGEGLSPKEIHSITKQLEGNFSIKNFRPGKRYLVEKDPSGDFLCFTYHQSPSHILHIQKDPASEQFSIWDEKFDYQKRVAAISGTISSNLSAELQKRHRYGLITQLQKLFACTVNFKRDIQPGTEYNILFEEKWLNDEYVGVGNILAAEIIVGNTPAAMAYRFTDSKGHTAYYDAMGKSLQSSLFVNPCNYSRISSRFGYRTHPILRKRHFHGGVDLAAPRGTPVYAAAGGKIIFRGRKGAAGNMVTIVHANGYHTKYLHLSRFSSNARQGSRVKQGQVIGYVGSTGRSTGPHLDFRVIHKGKSIDPLVALRSAYSTKGIPKAEMNKFLAQLSMFHMQLESKDVLVAGNAKNAAGRAYSLN